MATDCNLLSAEIWELELTYDFKNLSPADFEDLVRDLIGRELGFRFEAFSAGPDGGIDGRHAKGRLTVLQAKHYAGSEYAALKSQMKRERPSIDKVSPQRYILATSTNLSPARKGELSAIIGTALQDEADIFGSADLNGLLRKFPDIDKSHIKLWLSGAPMLERVLRSAQHMFRDITLGEIEARVRVYVPNPSFKDARDTLEKQHIVIISGPPGVGKTTLAEILSFAYLGEGWEFEAIRSLEDGFAAIDDTKKQVFFFDDFLGKVALDRHALSHKDSDLARFISRVRKSPNARFVLTTRAYIFEEARRVSEYLADRRLDISKYVLDVGVYTRRIKARILYNHLLVASTPQPYISALIDSEKIASIVDHKNYNPRIIEWMTDKSHLGDTRPEDYPSAFLFALDHPNRLWDIAFRNHISKSCQHLLFALFFGSEYGVMVDDLRPTFNALHAHMCTKYGEPHDPKDFEEALHILEGGFIALSDRRVSFVNPSLRDYLTEYLNDIGMLLDMAASATKSSFAQTVWEHGKEQTLASMDLRSFALAFLAAAEGFSAEPVWRLVADGTTTRRYSVGLSNTDRIELLIDLAEASDDGRFLDYALELARAPIDGLDPWRDGDSAITLIGKLRDPDYFSLIRHASEIAEGLELASIVMVDSSFDSDDLEKISDAAEDWASYLSANLVRSIHEAIQYQVAQIEACIEDIDSTTTLDDHIKTLKKMASRANIASRDVETAITKIKSKIALIDEESEEPSSPSFSGRQKADADVFDDTALRNLFASLKGN